MEFEHSNEFDQQIKVDTDDVALNRNMYQIMMQDVVVKQEDISFEDNSRHVEINIADDRVDTQPPNAIRVNLRNNANIIKSKSHSTMQPIPIKHRRCSRIEKTNVLACHRYLQRRPQPIVDVHNQSSRSGFSEVEIIAEEVSAELSNDDIPLDSSPMSENIDGEQSTDSIHDEIEQNVSSVFLDSTPSDILNAMNGTPSEATNAILCTTTNPLDVAFQESTIDSIAGDSQIYYANGTVQVTNLYGIVMPEPPQHFEYQLPSMAGAQYVQNEVNNVAIPIVFDGQQIRPAEEVQIVTINTTQPVGSQMQITENPSQAVEHPSQAVEHPSQAVENRCDPCAHTFKTARNLEKHLLSKKHSQKIARLNRQM